MKKIVLTLAICTSAMFAFDMGGALKNVGTSALNGKTDSTSLTNAAVGSAVTPEALGGQLANTVKATNSGTTTPDKAKDLCTQASSVQSMANINSDLLKQAISICTQNVSK